MTVKNEVPFDSNDGDSIIAITLTDRDPQFDAADGAEKGTIVDPGALSLASGGGSFSSSSGGGGGGGSCFINTAGGEFSWVGFFSSFLQ